METRPRREDPLEGSRLVLAAPEPYPDARYKTYVLRKYVPCEFGQGPGLAAYLPGGQIAQAVWLFRLSLQAVSRQTSLSPAVTGSWRRGVGQAATLQV